MADIQSILDKGFVPSELDFAFCAYCKMRVIVGPNDETLNEADLTDHNCRGSE
jgi:hypothetical protein